MPPEAAISIPSVTKTVPKMSDQSNGNKSLCNTLTWDCSDVDLSDGDISIAELSSSVNVACRRLEYCKNQLKLCSLHEFSRITNTTNFRIGSRLRRRREKV